MRALGDGKQASRFICILCLNQNQIGNGIQRKNQRERYHIKDLYCLNCKKVTKNIEIRYCDDEALIFEKASQLHIHLYNEGESL